MRGVPPLKRIYRGKPPRSGIIRRWFVRDPRFKGEAALTNCTAWPPLRAELGVPIVIDLGELDDETPALAFACEIEDDDGAPFRVVFEAVK